MLHCTRILCGIKSGLFQESEDCFFAVNDPTVKRSLFTAHANKSFCWRNAVGLLTGLVKHKCISDERSEDYK